MSVSVDIVIPVYNEELSLKNSIVTLESFLTANFMYNWRIVIADNASTDKTAEIGKNLQTIHKNVKFVHLDKKGRGRALRKTWMESDADIVCYMDVDLSTSLNAFPKLISAIVNGSDIAIGSRLHQTSNTYRSFRREFLSRSYNLFLKFLLQISFRDAQCGFKALSRRAVHLIVPRVKNKEWFFDTEVLVIGEKLGLNIAEIPVEWKEEQVEGRASTVKVFGTIFEDIQGAMRLALTRKRWMKNPNESD